MYKSSLRHIHDPVLSSLKMQGIRLLLFKDSVSGSAYIGAHNCMIRDQLTVNICTETDVAYVQIFGKRCLCAVNNITYRNVI
jgi:hypothetical protein